MLLIYKLLITVTNRLKTNALMLKKKKQQNKTKKVSDPQKAGQWH